MAEEQSAPSTTVIRRGSNIRGSAVLIIEGFEVEIGKCKIGELIQSEKFYVKDASFVITVWPNDDDEDTGEKVVSVMLSNIGQNKEMVKIVKFTINGNTWKIEDLTLGGIEDETDDVGMKFSHEELRALLEDGTLKVTVEVEMVGDRRVVKRTTEIPKASSQWVLEEMYYNNMKETDFTLVCEDQNIPCHKIVLSSASPYFRGMMDPTNEQFKEYKEGSAVAQCSQQVGYGFVKFLYTAEIQKTVLEDNYETFLRYGVWLHVQIL